jgi:hypothetical protein
MKTRRFWTAVVGVFVVSMVYEFIVHGWLMSGWFYKGLTPKLFIPNAAARSLPWLATISIYVAGLLGAFFFTYIFSKGVEGKGWLKEGFRYGVVVWGLVSLSATVGMYGWSQFPGKLLIYWILFGFVEFVILGWVCAFLYSKEAKTP